MGTRVRSARGTYAALCRSVPFHSVIRRRKGRVRLISFPRVVCVCAWVGLGVLCVREFDQWPLQRGPSQPQRQPRAAAPPGHCLPRPRRPCRRAVAATLTLTLTLGSATTKRRRALCLL